MDTFPWAVQSPIASARATRCIVWTLTWSVDGLRFGPRRARRCPVARVCTLAQLGHQLAAGEPPRAMPQHALGARPGLSALRRVRAVRRRGRVLWVGLAGRGPRRSSPIRRYGRAAADRARTVRVGHTRVLAQWPFEIRKFFFYFLSVSI
jgi:hypothetical protein